MRTHSSAPPALAGWWDDAQTAGSMLTAQQPENNIVRVAVQALAAVLGGCQSLHTNSMDEALSLPSEQAVRIALRTQQVLAHESGVADVADPLGGSYTVERITRRIEEEAEAYIAKIDGLGGSVHAIAFMQREIQEAAYRYQQEVEAKQRVVVGVNEFVMDEPPPANLFQVDPAVGEALAERLAACAGAATATGRAARSRPWTGRPRPRQPAAAYPGRGAGARDARRDLRHAAAGVRRPPALGGLLGVRRRLALAPGLRAALLVAAAPGRRGGHRGPGGRDLRPPDPGRGQRLPARRGPGGRGGWRPALHRPHRKERRAARPGVLGVPQGRGLPPSRSTAGPSAATRTSWAMPRSSARAPAVLRGARSCPPRAKPPAQPEDGVRITKGRIRVAVAPATDLTKANADLRRVPFMLAHALEQTKRFQVADPRRCRSICSARRRAARSCS